MTNTYHDPRLNAQMKSTRAAVKGHAPAERELARLEDLLRGYDRVMKHYDARYALQAEQALADNNHPSASTAAWLIWSSDVRESILARVRLPMDSNYSDRLADNALLGREVLV